MKQKLLFYERKICHVIAKSNLAMKNEMIVWKCCFLEQHILWWIICIRLILVDKFLKVQKLLRKNQRVIANE